MRDCKLHADCNLLIKVLNIQELYNFINWPIFFIMIVAAYYMAYIKIIVINLQYNLHITP